MSEILLEQMPLLVAAVALILGVLIGKMLASRITSRLVQSAFLLCLLAAVIFGGNVTSWAVEQIAGVGLDFETAKYLAVGALSFVSGICFPFIMGQPAKKPTA